MENSELIKLIANKTQIPSHSLIAAIKLFDEGKTIPFIARYRKEVTSNLDENQLREILINREYFENLLHRKEFILDELQKNKQLTANLKKIVDNAQTLPELENIYKPYKKKRKTKAQIAIELGLKPVSDFIKKSRSENRIFLEKFVNKKELKSTDDVLKYASYIVEQEIFENARTIIKDFMKTKGRLICSKKKNADNPTYKIYYDFSIPIKYIEPYQTMAIMRAEKEKIISAKIEPPYLPIEKICRFLKFYPEKAYYQILYNAVESSIKEKLIPSVENELKSELKEIAENRSLEIFAKNLDYLLMTPTLKRQKVLGIDPGFRTGCKIALIDEWGKLLEYGVIYPTPPRNDYEKSKETLIKLHQKYGFTLITIGNGTASYETELFVQKAIKNLNVKYTIISEAGASVYSTSKIAQEEFKELSPVIRSAISIARRAQSFLDEMVKIPPESIGVGMYQHDVDKKKLKERLAIQVESVVNRIGVNINTASLYLLKYVSGISDTIAKNILEYRSKKTFDNRNELKKVKGIGEKTFLLAVGFCRVPNSKNKLDNTIVHPESYEKVYEIGEMLNFKRSELFKKWDSFKEKLKTQSFGDDESAFLKEAILNENYDPRDSLPKPMFNRDIKSIEDLKEGMSSIGLIKNILDFGIFVDIGTKENGLIHKSVLKNVKNIYENYFVGQIIKVKITKVDIATKRINLTPD